MNMRSSQRHKYTDVERMDVLTKIKAAMILAVASSQRLRVSTEVNKNIDHTITNIDYDFEGYVLVARVTRSDSTKTEVRVPRGDKPVFI